MRLVYLDESGTTAKATSLVVAGVIVHGDQQWRSVDRRITDLIEKYISEEDRDGFVFHATDIFHGSRYFDRSKPKWTSREQRWPILDDLAQILADLDLPVIAGSHDKVRWNGQKEDPNLVHSLAVVDCLYWADAWLAANAPDELATVVHEDGSSAKSIIKHTVRAIRYPHQLAPDSADYYIRMYGIPFEHIIDTVHFAEKGDARLLQLADLCAFTIGRAIQSRDVPPDLLKIVLRQVDWIQRLQKSSPTALWAALDDWDDLSS